MVIGKNPKERIVEMLSKGYTKIQTIRAMRNEGYAPREVDSAMSAVVDEQVVKEDISETIIETHVKNEPKPRPEPVPDSELTESMTKQFESIKKHIEDNRKRIESVAVKDMKGFRSLKSHEVGDVVHFQVKLEKMHEELKDDFKEMSEEMENFRGLMKSFGKKMDSIERFEEKIDKIDLKQLKREIEVLKTKSHWIEDNLERIDFAPMLDKMKEVEHKIDTLKATSPYVIE